MIQLLSLGQSGVEGCEGVSGGDYVVGGVMGGGGRRRGTRQQQQQTLHRNFHCLICSARPANLLRFDKNVSLTPLKGILSFELKAVFKIKILDQGRPNIITVVINVVIYYIAYLLLCLTN